MSVILVLIPLSILFAVCFLAAFVWAVRSGQFEDTCTPSMRILMDNAEARQKPPVAPSTATASQTKTTPADSSEVKPMAISAKPGDTSGSSMPRL